MNEDDNISPQEHIIYEIVEDILRTEDKIAELNESLTQDSSSASSLELIALKNEKSKCFEQIKALKEEQTAQLIPNQRRIAKKEAEVNKLKSRISATESQLKHLSASTKGNVYMMSYEKIEDMINSKKSNDDMKMIDQEIATTESLKSEIEASLVKNKYKQNEINECMNMLKEEKMTYQTEVINIISQKESIEEVIKHFALNSKQSNKSGTTLILNGNNKEIDLSYYEVAKADINKVVNEINELFIDRHALSQSQGANGSYSNVQSLYMTNSMKNLILEYINQSPRKEEATEAFIRRLSSQLVKMAKRNQIALNELPITDYTNEITKELYPPEDLFNEEALGLHIKYVFKAFSYEGVINQILAFTSKEYKAMKKTFAKQANLIQNTITKIVTRIDEIDNKLFEIRKKKKFLDNHKPKEVVELSNEEKEYIKQNESLTVLKREKEDIEAEIEGMAYKNREIKEDYEKKIEEKREDEKAIDQKIEGMAQAMKQEQLDMNNAIISLRQQIAEKFTIIKAQLKIYRENHGNNLLLYNKLVESINSTIRATSKNPLASERSLITSPSQIDTNRSQTIHSVYNSKNYLSHSSSMTNVYSLRGSKQREALSLNSDEMSYQEKIAYSTRKRTNNQAKSPLRQVSTEQTTIWLKERDKLNRTIKNLKEKISKSETIFDKNAILRQLKPLRAFTPCYSRFVCSKDKKFNPLNDSLTSSKDFAFIKAAIALDDSFYSLLIRNTQDEIKSILLESINNTIVSTVIKHIIQIFRESRKSKSRLSIEDIAKREEFASIPLTNSEKAKAALNTHFNFSIQIQKEQRIEFVFSSYEDFKLWLNGLAFVIKNRGLMSKYHSLLK